jgi:hypothetical protein
VPREGFINQLEAGEQFKSGVYVARRLVKEEDQRALKSAIREVHEGALQS